METELQIWKSRAEVHEENYLQMLKRIDEVVKERDLWQKEAKRWRDMYLEYDEMLEGQVQDAVERLDKVWKELDQLKKQIKKEFE